MLVGDTYEMYTPVAQAAERAIGCTFVDNKGYSFIYGGSWDSGSKNYILTKDVSYDASVIGEEARKGGIELAAKLEGLACLCPDDVAAKCIRPVTHE